MEEFVTKNYSIRDTGLTCKMIGKNLVKHKRRVSEKLCHMYSVWRTILTKLFWSSASWFFSSLFWAIARLSAVLSPCITSSSRSLSTVASVALSTAISSSMIRSSFSLISLTTATESHLSTPYKQSIKSINQSINHKSLSSIATYKVESVTKIMQFGSL